MYRIRRTFPVLVLISCAWCEDPAAILEYRVSKVKKATGIVAGVIDASGKRTVVAAGDGLNGDSVLEIGSITKVFTSLILADMFEHGEVTPDTPVSKLLPADWKVPAGSGGKPITLLQLSQQVSGLPRMPSNFHPADISNPYVDYTPKLLNEFLSSYSLTRAPGEKYEYSNLAVGLLGYALAQKAGTSYEALVRKRVLDPLGMSSTSVTLSEDQRRRLARGHSPELKVVSNWDLSEAVAGAGGLRSTVNDMLKFMAAAAGWTDTPLKAAFARMRSVTLPTGSPNLDIQMAWHVIHRGSTEIVWHNGGTGGYRSFAGFVPATKVAVVVLCDTSHSVDDIGLHILDSRVQLAFRERTAISLPEEVLEKYAGKYQVTPDRYVVVSRRGSQLFAQPKGQPEAELFAEKPGEFFLKIVDAQFRFVEENGKVVRCIMTRGGQNTTMDRVP